MMLQCHSGGSQLAFSLVLCTGAPVLALRSDEQLVMSVRASPKNGGQLQIVFVAMQPLHDVVPVGIYRHRVDSWDQLLHETVIKCRSICVGSA